MAALPKLYQDGNRYTSHWFRFPDGQVLSFRWRQEDAEEKRAKLPVGAVEVADPFRKGAPLGGFANNQPTNGVRL